MERHCSIWQTGREYSFRRSNIPEKPERKQRKELTLLEINKLAAQLFLLPAAQAKAERSGLCSILSDRGLSEETMKKFGLGYSDKYSDDLYKFLKSKGLQ